MQDELEQALAAFVEEIRPALRVFVEKRMRAPADLVFRLGVRFQGEIQVHEFIEVPARKLMERQTANRT